MGYKPYVTWRDGIENAELVPSYKSEEYILAVQQVGVYTGDYWIRIPGIVNGSPDLENIPFEERKTIETLVRKAGFKGSISFW